MSRISATLCYGLSSFLSLIPLAAATATDSILLKAKSDASADTYAEVTTDVKQTMMGPQGKPMEVIARSIYGVLARSAPKGDATELTTTLDRLYGSILFRNAGESGGIAIVYDTDDPESDDGSPDHKAAFGLMLNAPLKLTIDQQGLATAVEGAEPIRKKLLNLGEQNFIAKSLADDEFNDRQVMSTFAELPRMFLANREVKVGESWKGTRTDTYPQVGKIIVNYDCTLESIEKTSGGDKALIRFKGTIEKDPTEKPAEGKQLGKIDGTFSGSARFSASAGQIVEIEREAKAKIEVPAWWSKDPATPPMQIDSTFKTTYATNPTADRLKNKDEIAKKVADSRAKREAEEAAAMAGPVDPVTPENAPVAWLQWGGANRNFCSDSTGLANRWPKSGPPKLWERPLGDGFSTVLCDGETLYTMYSVREKDDPFKGDEVVVALDAKTGKTRWEHKYAAPWPKDLQMEFGPGPHSTPVLIGDRLFTIGCTAKLICLDKNTGSVLWTEDLLADHKAALNMRGYGSSPLAYKGNILLPVSETKGEALIAFSQSDGSVAWKGGNFEPGYSSLLVIDAGGSDQLLAFTGKALCGLDPAGGGTLWRVDHSTQFGANISTPVWSPQDQLVFISSAYGMGARGIKLESAGGQTTAREIWQNNKMKIQHADAVRVGDWVYGSSGDFGPSFFCSINARTGEFGWRQRGIAKATVVAADGKLIVLDEDGTLLLVKADPTNYRLLAKAAGICRKTAWTTPTLYGRTLFVRDRSNIAALDLGAKAVQ